ncbi:hypothetical protein NIES4106_53510 [Fischerella sp. NIES-4106]|nr:hypothetical protein NIES4106_10220 [Fischerella sp. NIES-4106]BAZ70556.1 hypothetical protein NIES4106_53510 [Fischerella sp. NIES-4106]
MSFPPQTKAGLEVYREATEMWRAINYRAEDFKKLRELRSTIAEINQIRKGVSSATQSVKDLNKQFGTYRKIVDVLNKDVGKIIPDIKEAAKGWKFLKAGQFKQIGGQFAKRFGGLAAGAVGAGALTFLVLKNEEIQKIQLSKEEVNQNELDRMITLISKVANRITANEKLLAKIQPSIDQANKKSNDALYETRASRTKLEAKIAIADKKGNDALYETRSGRNKLEAAIAEARKKGNDALYETRQLKAKVEQQIKDAVTNITNIQKQFSQSLNSKNNNELLSGINALQKDVALTKTEVAKRQQEIKAVEDTAKNIQTGLDSIKAKNAEIQKNNETFKVNIYREFDDQKILIDTKIARVGDTITTVTSRMGKLESTSTSQQNTQQQQAAQIEKINGRIDGLEGDLKKQKQSQVADPAVPIAIQEAKDAKAKAEQIEKDIGSIKTDINTSKTDLQKISTDFDKRLKEQEKVNKEALPKLDNIIGILGLIPARAAGLITPQIPTIPQIEQAAATGTCRTTQPGGCMRKALDDNAANINANTNANANNILDGINAGANATQLGLLQKIDNKLGDQLPGGIGGKMSRIAEWLHLDRALNLMIFAATVHNALMLSNDIGQTLLGAISNVLQLIGLKKEDGSAFDLGSVISSSIESFITSIIGADNYTVLKESWAKANRIYQATTNVLNSFLNLSQTILQASELIAGYTGKIGNALKKGGVILENAYGWMNPQPKFNRVTQFLEGLQNGASTIQMVTQAPLDVVNATTEFTTASTEFVKAIKEDDKPENKATPTPEPDELKAKEIQSKTNSQPNPFDFSDLFDGED